MSDIIALIISAPLALMFIVLGLPLYFKKVRRNYFYGYRVSQYAMLDDDIWYAVNQQGGKQLIIIGGLLMLNALFALIFIGRPKAQGTILYVDLAITLSGVIYSVIRGTKLNNRMAQEKGLRDHINPKNIYKLNP
jgi:hypothetical protein